MCIYDFDKYLTYIFEMDFVQGFLNNVFRIFISMIQRIINLSQSISAIDNANNTRFNTHSLIG